MEFKRLRCVQYSQVMMSAQLIASSMSHVCVALNGLKGLNAHQHKNYRRSIQPQIKNNNFVSDYQDKVVRPCCGAGAGYIEIDIWHNFLIRALYPRVVKFADFIKASARS